MIKLKDVQRKQKQQQQQSLNPRLVGDERKKNQFVRSCCISKENYFEVFKKKTTAKACMGKSLRIFGRFVGTSITGTWNIFKNSFSCNVVEIFKIELITSKLKAIICL